MSDIVINVGDFITTNKSINPAIVISNKVDNIDNKLLISITEYNGDYLFIDKRDVNIILIDNYSKLSILAGFGKFYYKEHKELYQNLIINTIIDNK